MKCQSTKYSKHSSQAHTSVHSKGHHRPMLALQETSSVYHTKHQDRNAVSPTAKMRKETQNICQRNSSSSDVSPSSSPTLCCFYAGAKFSGAPSPTDLPKPPSHWTHAPFKMSSGGMLSILQSRADKHRDFTSQMKVLVNTPA